MKTSIEGGLGHLKSHAEAVNTDRCEAAAKRLVESLKNPKLPGDYAKQARGVLDSLLLHGFMKATALAAKSALDAARADDRSEEHTSELQSLMRISSAVFCLKKKTTHNQRNTSTHHPIYHTTYHK